jgi:hypothetical protein
MRDVRYLHGRGKDFLGTHRQTGRFHGMNEQAEACRGMAKRCERAAALATRPDLRAVYRDLARQWRDMAKQSENLERLHFAAIGQQ